MNAEQIVQAMGGRKRVMEITGLTKGRISQWIIENHIPTPWLKLFRALQPSTFEKMREDKCAA
jgi:hypothetical protein